VLLLDEATLGLDVDARRSLWPEVRELARRGRTVFFSTHYLEEVYAVDLMRGVLSGQFLFPVWLSSAVLFGFIAVVSGLVLRAFRRREDG
jgi:ABC-type uncharacterized transport system ATPase subunit